MYRKIVKVKSKEDLLVELPEEYLNKQVEIIASEVGDEPAKVEDRKAVLAEAMKFFDSIHADMSNFKFDRDEANER